MTSTKCEKEDSTPQLLLFRNIQEEVNLSPNANVVLQDPTPQALAKKSSF